MFLVKKLAGLRERIEKDLSGKPVIWIAAVMIAGFLAYYLDTSAKPEVGVQSPESPEVASTFIPAGFVLVPIEVANFESLDSILGQHGVVDLYIPADETRKRATKIAERIKILRAPLNPSHFAVLAPEAESSRLVGHAGPFVVVVQPAKILEKSSGTKFVNDTQTKLKDSGEKRRRRSRVTVEGVVDAES